MEKALVPLRYQQGQGLDHGELSSMVTEGYVTAFLTHADYLLADAWRNGWTNHPRESEGEEEPCGDC